MKTLIEENKFYFRLYYHLYRKHRGIKPNWFSRETELYFDGYPRSGNTFLRHLTREIMPDIIAVHHFHKVAPIKIALEKKLPVYILTRNPKEAITSNYLKHYALRKIEIPKQINIKLLNNKAVDYLNYYKYVGHHLDQLTLISFTFLIKNPEEVVKAIAKKVNSVIDITLIDSAIKSYRGATDILGSSKPNAFKQKKKEELLTELQKTKAYSGAVAVYNDIMEKAEPKYTRLV